MGKVIPYIILCSCLSFCTTKKTETKGISENAINDKFKNRFIPDTNFYKKINEYVSVNRKGDIGYKFIAKPECDTCAVYEYFVTVAEIARPDKKGEPGEVYSEVPLNKLIDTSSLKILSNVYFKDIHQVYCLRMNNGGGHVYQVAGADAASFKIYSDTMSYLAYDKSYFYDHDSRISKKEAEDLKKGNDNSE